jgi:hypothetical protein
MRKPIYTQNTPTITHNQAIALKQLDDGRWQSLAAFSAHTRVSLYALGLTEDRGPRGIITRADRGEPARAGDAIGSAALDYRITDDGRTMLRAKGRAA